MTPNPYEPPRATTGAGAVDSGVRLFGATAIALHAALLMPIVGAVLAAINYRRLRDPARLRWTVLLYVLPSLALVFFAVAVAGAGQRVLVFGANMGLTVALYRDQRPLLERHLAAGGRKARWYVATLITLAILVAGVAVWQLLDPSAAAPSVDREDEVPSVSS